MPKQEKKSSKEITKLTEIIEKLANNKTLEPEYCDHALSENYKGYFSFVPTQARGNQKKGGSIVLLSRFDLAVQALSKNWKQNIRILRNWAQSKGWVKKTKNDGPEVWGLQQNGIFFWRIKIKPEVSTRQGLESSSQKPRFDARLNDKGTYINPFSGQTGNRSMGTHLDLE